MGKIELSPKAKNVLRIICIIAIILGTAGFVLLGGTEGGVLSIVSGVIAGIGLIAGVIAIIKGFFKK